MPMVTTHHRPQSPLQLWRQSLLPLPALSLRSSVPLWALLPATPYPAQPLALTAAATTPL